MKKFLRAIRLTLGKWLFDRKTHRVDPSTLHIKKILFLRHDGKIGDYIVSSFVFRELKKQDPNLHIGVVCSTQLAYLFKQNPFIDQIYFVKKRNILDYLNTAKIIRQENYDILIDPTACLRNRDLLFIQKINAKCNIGYQKADYNLFDLTLSDPTLHFSQIYQNALAMLGYQGINTDYDLPVDYASQQAICQFLENEKLTNYIAINFFGAGSARSFNAEKIQELLNTVRQYTALPIVLLTFPAVTPQLTSLLNCVENVFIYADTKTIFHTIELIRHARLVISPDTAIIHIASGLKKPMIAFYSNDVENFNHWHPNSTAPVHLLRYEKNVNHIQLSELNAEWFEAK